MKPTHKMHAGRWKSASAFVLIPLMISASGGTLSSTSVADETTIPHVPSTPYDQPASVQPAVAINASPVTAVAEVKAIAEVATIDIPAAALLAYQRTETLLSDADPECNLPWTLVAAIGRIESNHGRTGGNSLDADGVATPGIYGIPLDGSEGTATIPDTDDGKLDSDERWDRAVGPMQFIPSTWTSVAIDSDNDGKSDPQNILDAAAAAGVYLCAGGDDLATDEGAREAVHRYNHSDSYVDNVLAIAKQYANGSFTDLPSSFFAATPVQTGLFPSAPVEAEGEKRDVTTGGEPKPGAVPTNPIAPEGGSNSVPETDPGSEPVAPEPEVQPVVPEPEVQPAVPEPEFQPAAPKTEIQTGAPEPDSPPVEEDPPPAPPELLAGTEPDAEI